MDESFENEIEFSRGERVMNCLAQSIHLAILGEGVNKATNAQILSKICCEHCRFGKDCGDENGLLHCFFHDKAIEADEVCANFQKKLGIPARIH